MLLVLWASGARAWELGEVRPLDLGPALASSPAWDGAPAWFTGGEDGVRVLSPTDGGVLLRSDVLHPRDLLVRDLDGTGEPEVVACGPEGIALVRGHRVGLALPRPLADAPCSALVAYDLERYPALATLGEGGELVTWSPKPGGLTREDTGVVAAPGGLLAASGPRVAVVDRSGDLHLTAPDELIPGPVTALVALPEGFAWALAGDAPSLNRTGADPVPLDAPITGLAAGAGGLWLLDAPGKRLRWLGGDGATGDWAALPVEPRRAVVVDADADGCEDLLVAGAEGGGALVVGRCAPAASVEAAIPVSEAEAEAAPAEVPSELPVEAGVLHRAPAEMEVGGPWKVLDVRVGESLSTKLSLADGRGHRWASRGGPPGFSVLQDGTVDYDATDEEDVGRWRVSVKATGGGFARWAGFEVHVWPGSTPMDGDPAPPREVRDAGGVAHRPLLPGVQAQIALGVAGGAAKTNGTTWEHLGEAATVGGGSPMGALTASVGGAPFALWAGVDSAPFFTYAAAPNDRTHAFAFSLGAQLGTATTALGPYGTYGLSSRGVGLRFVTTPFHDGRDHAMGVEARALWLAPQLGGEASLAWLWTM